MTLTSTARVTVNTRIRLMIEAVLLGPVRGGALREIPVTFYLILSSRLALRRIVSKIAARRSATVCKIAEAETNHCNQVSVTSKL